MCRLLRNERRLPTDTEVEGEVEGDGCITPVYYVRILGLWKSGGGMRWEGGPMLGWQRMSARPQLFSFCVQFCNS